MTTNVINVNCGAPSEAPEGGTPITREYSPLTILEDRLGREWTVSSYGTSAWIVGVMPPFEALAIWRIEREYGPLVVKRASDNHRFLRHPYGLPGCPNCPPMVCHCGKPSCTDYEVHRREWVGTETAWRTAA